MNALCSHDKPTFESFVSTILPVLGPSLEGSQQHGKVWRAANSIQGLPCQVWTPFGSISAKINKWILSRPGVDPATNRPFVSMRGGPVGILGRPSRNLFWSFRDHNTGSEWLWLWQHHWPLSFAFGGVIPRRSFSDSLSRISIVTFLPGDKISPVPPLQRLSLDHNSFDHSSLLGTGDPSSIFRWIHSLGSEARYRLRTNTPSRATFDQKQNRMACLGRLVLRTVPSMASMLRSRRSEKNHDARLPLATPGSGIFSAPLRKGTAWVRYLQGSSSFLFSSWLVTETLGFWTWKPLHTSKEARVDFCLGREEEALKDEKALESKPSNSFGWNNKKTPRLGFGVVRRNSIRLSSWCQRALWGEGSGSSFSRQLPGWSCQ